MLNEGSLVGIDVIVLLINTTMDVPDFNASAVILNAVTKLVPGFYCDISSLTDEAESIENKMKEVRNGHNKSLSFYK